MLRKRPSKSREIPAYIDTPAGIVTPTGVRFITTRSLLEEYAPGLFEEVSLERLILRAEVWLRSAQTLALWALAGLLFLVTPWVAALIALLVYVIWEVFSTIVVSRRLAAVLRVLEHPLVQGALYVAILSILGMRGELAAVAVGLAAFIGFRWQLIPFVLRPMVRAIRRPVSQLPPADQVLRAFVMRAALEHDISLPQLESFRRPFGS